MGPTFRSTCWVLAILSFFCRRTVRLMRYSCFSLVKSNSMLSVLDSLLMSSAALWLPPRWWPNSAYVTASNTLDLPLPLVPESIHSGDPSKRISCSSL